MFLFVPVQKRLDVKVPDSPQNKQGDKTNPENGDVSWKRLHNQVPVEFEYYEPLGENYKDHHPRLLAEFLAISI